MLTLGSGRYGTTLSYRRREKLSADVTSLTGWAGADVIGLFSLNFGLSRRKTGKEYGAKVSDDKDRA